MKGIYIFLVLLCSYCVQAAAGNFQFPSIQVNKLTPKQKEFLLRDIHHFIKEYEKKQLETYSLVDPATSPLWNVLIGEAYALDPEKMCLYGGWPSEREAGGSCIRPQIKNNTYKQYDDRCEESELYCNPTLFGHDICVPFATSDQRNSAYQSCNRQFRERGRTLAQVVSLADGGELNELLMTTKNICAFGKQAGTGMCHSLMRKLELYVDIGTPLVIEQLIHASQSKDPDYVVQALNSAGDRLDEIQERLRNECGQDLAEKSQEEYQAYFSSLEPQFQQECLDLANEFTELQEYIQRLLGDMEAHDPDFYQELMCGETPVKPILETTESEQLEEVVEKVQCAPEIAKSKRENCLNDVGCAIMSDVFLPLSIISDFTSKKKNSCLSSDNSCLVNAITAMFKNLTDLVTGLWDLAVMGAEWAGKKIAQGWRWLWGIENKTSDAQNAIAGMDADDVNQMKENPGKWYERLWDGIKTSFNTFLKEHVGCEKWSGVPHYSQCLEPFTSFECMSCKTYITGACTAIGYIAPEILTLVGSGGLSSLLKGGVTASKTILTAVKASSKFKNMTKLAKGSLVAKTYGKVAGKAKTVMVATKTAVKPLVTKLKPIGQWGNNILKSGLTKFMNSTEVYIAKKLIAKMSALKEVTVKQVGSIKKLVLNKVDVVVKSSTVQATKQSALKLKASAAKTFDVEIDMMKAGGNSVKNAYRKFERAVNDPLYQLSDDMVKGSEKLAYKINPAKVAARTGTSVGVQGGTKALSLSSMQKRFYTKAEVDDYFASFVTKPNKRKYYGDFLHDIADKYPKMTTKQLDELKNMMYNIHKTCNPVWPSKVVTGCKKRMLATFKGFLKEKYPKLDPDHVNLMARADVRVLGEAAMPRLQDLDTAGLMSQKNALKNFDINKFMGEGYESIDDVIEYHKTLFAQAEEMKKGASSIDLKQLDAIQEQIKNNVAGQIKIKAKNAGTPIDDIDWGAQSNTAVQLEANLMKEAEKRLDEITEQYRPDQFGKRLEKSKKLPMDQRRDELDQLLKDTNVEGASNYPASVYSEFYSGAGQSKYGELIPQEKIMNFEDIKRIHGGTKSQLDEVNDLYLAKNRYEGSFRKYRNTDDGFHIKNERRKIDQDIKFKREDKVDPKDISEYRKSQYNRIIKEHNEYERQLRELKKMAEEGHFSDDIVTQIQYGVTSPKEYQQLLKSEGFKKLSVKDFIKSLENKIKDAEEEVKTLENLLLIENI